MTIGVLYQYITMSGDDKNKNKPMLTLPFFFFSRSTKYLLKTVVSVIDLLTLIEPTGFVHKFEANEDFF